MANIAQSIQKFVIDLDIDGLTDLDGLTKALQGTTQAAKFTDISFKETIKSITNFTQASGRTTNSIQAQIRAFSQLRSQTAINSKFYNELTTRVGALNREYAQLTKQERELAKIRSEQYPTPDRRKAQYKSGKQWAAEISGIAASPTKANKLAQQVSALEASLGELNITQREYTDYLATSISRQNQYNEALARQETLARNLVAMDREKGRRNLGGWTISTMMFGGGGKNWPDNPLARDFQSQGLGMDAGQKPWLSREPTWPLNKLNLGGKLGQSIQGRNWFYDLPFIVSNWARRFLKSHLESPSFLAQRDLKTPDYPIGGKRTGEQLPYIQKYGISTYGQSKTSVVRDFAKTRAGYAAELASLNRQRQDLTIGSAEYIAKEKEIKEVERAQAKAIEKSTSAVERKTRAIERSEKIYAQRGARWTARSGAGGVGTRDPETGAMIAPGRGGAIVPYRTGREWSSGIYGPQQRVGWSGAPTMATHGPMREITGFYQGITDLGMGKVNRSIDLMGKSWKKAALDINRAAKAGDKSITSLEKQRNLWSELRGRLDAGSLGFTYATRKIQQIDKALSKANASGGRFRNNFAAIGGVLSAGLFGGPSGLVGGAIGAGVGKFRGLTGPELGGAAVTGGLIATQAAGAVQGLATTATYAADYEKSKIALRGITRDEKDPVKSMQNYKTALDAAAQATRDYNIPQEDAIKGVTRLSAAVLGSGGNINNATEAYLNTIAAIKGTAGSADDARSAITAMVQIFSKGKVSAEELSGQLGERFPAAVTQFAKANNISTQELQKSLKEGRVGLDMLTRFVESLGAQYSDLAKEIAASSEEAGARATVTFNDFRLAAGGALKDVGADLQEIIAGLLVELVPVISLVVKTAVGALRIITEPLKTVIKFVRELPGLLLAVKIGAAALAAPSLIFGLTTAVKALKAWVGTLKLAKIQTDLLTLSMLKNPLFWVPAAIGIAAVGIHHMNTELDRYIDKVKEGTETIAKAEERLAKLQKQMDDPSKQGDIYKGYRARLKERIDKLSGAITIAGASKDKHEYESLKGNEAGGENEQEGPLAQLKAEFEDGMVMIENIWVNAFRNMENQLMTFLEGGKLNFKEFARSIISDIMRMIIKATILLPLMKMLGLGGGGGGLLGGLFGPKKKAAAPSTSGMGPFASGDQYGAALQGANTASYGPGSSQGFGLGTYGAGIPSGAAGWGFSEPSFTPAMPGMPTSSAIPGDYDYRSNQFGSSFGWPSPTPSIWSQGSAWEPLSDYSSFGNSNNPFTGNPHSIYEGIGTHGDFLPSNPAWSFQWGGSNTSDNFPGGSRQLLDLWRRGYGRGPQIASGDSRPWWDRMFTPAAAAGEMIEMYPHRELGPDAPFGASYMRNGRYYDITGDPILSAEEINRGRSGGFYSQSGFPDYSQYGDYLRENLGASGEGISGDADDAMNWMLNFFSRLVPGLAKGGIVGGPTLAHVGESGPEAVIPLKRGRDGKLGIAGDSGSGTNIVVNVDAKGTKVQGNNTEGDKLGRMIGAAIQAELVKQKRPGGILAT